jgi:hypothetical protein
LFVALVPVKYLFSFGEIVVEIPQNETLLAHDVDIVFM